MGCADLFPLLAILIQLGSEDVSLREIGTEKMMTDRQLMEILELLENLNKYALALRRHGGDFGDYLERRNPATHELPRHLVKVRDGNDESIDHQAT